jgi:ketosteroid isomerase-like protein
MDAVQLVERYLDTWNEPDPRARDAAVEAVWAEDARYVDPLAAVAGRDQIAGLIGAVQQQVPGHVFRLIDRDVDAHHNVMRFWWELVPEQGGDSLAIGFDVATTTDDGRIESVLGFLDKAPAAA